MANTENSCSTWYSFGLVIWHQDQALVLMLGAAPGGVTIVSVGFRGDAMPAMMEVIGVTHSHLLGLVADQPYAPAHFRSHGAFETAFAQ